MGMALLIESDPELECPEAFPDTDSKHFLGTMFGPRVEVLERRLKINLSPLKHCAVFVDEDSEEALGREWAQEAQQSSELAWNLPDEFITCLEQLTAALQKTGRKLPPAVLREIERDPARQGYYQEGYFYSDVVGCLAAIRSLKEQGAKRVRFFAY